ncbi:MAG: tRNA 5-methoxyuridine(34)/uridine 5-oxyacetic acid(34) synthase CmoB [Gammaproteobacteria bacterium]|nr:tRNA 5-methoxyuridine(34)/uridine 5-oxyacetic acid(34) synthase CmoB [Gammaproteobacteria bacterium]MBT8151687.1 tRNA 5-methoxyuridine(34)/uridine 5-oxyacetic acid(34) synthase CmoB [Gammaproteobacteria bacterium]NND39388.1 tRNA 5-methoxyuridine(34)/uridine 5-oxyacetic acid(34) synthase CmoB [Pseudomonadales bacterium]NNM11349.1 tRNA 5-methoxyuridine(34)/uridine 5-oxyacetic acid(34) synthase CmoB [Pseudomonadales bacterium]RZV58163.1 MAG: tRNA 5-methoxyuridine(34)/uridine 5-oxyacetic acid(34
MLDYGELPRLLNEHGMPALANALPGILQRGFDTRRYGDLPRWQQALDALPDIAPSTFSLGTDVVRVGTAEDLAAQQFETLEPREQLKQALRGLHPWRKGPFNFFGVHVDTEWRSDLKWNRLAAEIEPLNGKRVLDVGCGNGYHCWRMAGAGADFVLGIDPTPLFLMQFWAMQKYLRDSRVWLLPARCEEMPAGMKAFESVFSMGVLYHRRSPIDHLLELREALVSGGQLVLETLVIEGGTGEALVPEGRYGKMGNVWFIPSVETLQGWLRKVNFSETRLVDVSTTNSHEQRSTEWMQFQSLSDFLDPNDASRTLEGYPAPRRAILLARA